MQQIVGLISLTLALQVCYGSLNEVRRFEEYLYGKSERFAAVKA